MKNNTEQFEETDFDRTEFTHHHETQDAILESKNMSLVKDENSLHLLQPRIYKKAFGLDLKAYEKIKEKFTSYELENTYYCPSNEKHSDKKLVYILTIASVFFLSILLNSIFG